MFEPCYNTDCVYYKKEELMLGFIMTPEEYINKIAACLKCVHFVCEDNYISHEEMAEWSEFIKEKRKDDK